MYLNRQLELLTQKNHALEAENASLKKQAADTNPNSWIGATENSEKSNAKKLMSLQKQ